MCVFYWQSNTSFIFLFTSKNQNKWQNFYFFHLAGTFKSQAQLKIKRTFKIIVNIYLFTDSFLFWVAKDNRTLQFHSLSYNPLACDKNSHLTLQHPTQAGENCSVFCLMKCSIITFLDVSMCQTTTNTSIFFSNSFPTSISSSPPLHLPHPHSSPTELYPQPCPIYFFETGFHIHSKDIHFFVTWGISFAIVLKK